MRPELQESEKVHYSSAVGVLIENVWLSTKDRSVNNITHANPAATVPLPLLHWARRQPGSLLKPYENEYFANTAKKGARRASQPANSCSVLLLDRKGTARPHQKQSVLRQYSSNSLLSVVSNCAVVCFRAAFVTFVQQIPTSSLRNTIVNWSIFIV